MPTVSNRDLSGHWNEHNSAGESALSTKRFKEGQDLNVLPSPASAASHIAEEHGYAANQRFISSNSYYGYHPVMAAGNVEDCSMDTSENAANAGSNPNFTCGATEWLVSRKRCLDGGMDFDAATMSVSKRVRFEGVPETPLPCHPPLTSYQEPPEQQQLPGNTSYLMESVIPRPRGLMGHYV